MFVCKIGVDTSFQSSRRAKDENYNAGNLKPGERRNSDNTRSDSKLKSSENDDLKLGDTAESLGIGNPDLGMDKSDKTDTPPDCFPLWLTRSDIRHCKILSSVNEHHYIKVIVISGYCNRPNKARKMYVFAECQ